MIEYKSDLIKECSAVFYVEAQIFKKAHAQKQWSRTADIVGEEESFTHYADALSHARWLTENPADNLRPYDVRITGQINLESESLATLIEVADGE